jgi:hypothetical protein
LRTRSSVLREYADKRLDRE